MEPKQKVGANIRARRLELKLTQEQAAQKAGVHPVEYARAERGVRDLRISTIVKIARGLDIAPGRLLDGLDSP